MIIKFVEDENFIELLLLIVLLELVRIMGVFLKFRGDELCLWVEVEEECNNLLFILFRICEFFKGEDLLVLLLLCRFIIKGVLMLGLMLDDMVCFLVFLIFL